MVLRAGLFYPAVWVLADLTCGNGVTLTSPWCQNVGFLEYSIYYGRCRFRSEFIPITEN